MNDSNKLAGVGPQGFHYSISKPESATLGSLWRVVAQDRVSGDRRLVTLAGYKAKAQGVVEFLMGAPDSVERAAFLDGTPVSPCSDCGSLHAGSRSYCMLCDPNGDRPACR